MTTSQTTLAVIAFLLIGISSQNVSLGDDHPPDAAAAESPRAVVARWLELHRTGNRDEASALTTGSDYHRAHVLLPSKRDTGVRVERSLGNQRAAAVVTSALDDARDGERVLLFWLVRRDGAWRINKSDSFERRVVDERLRGFLEAGDVRWHVQRGQLVGHWEAGPCRLPGVAWIACGSRLQLDDDNRYRLVAWRAWRPGSRGRQAREMAGSQRPNPAVTSKSAHVCRVAWIADNLLVIEPLDGKGRAEYERTDAAQDRPEAVEGELDHERDDR